MHLDRRVPVWEDGTPIIDPSHACSFNPIGLGCLMKMGKNGLAALFVKVIDFPVAKTSEYASESMYVMLQQSVVPLKENFTEDEAKKWCRMYLASGEGILVNFQQIAKLSNTATLSVLDTVLLARKPNSQARKPQIKYKL